MKPIGSNAVKMERATKSSHRFRFRLQITPQAEGFLYLQAFLKH
jgi:hypothetical protein